MCFREIVSLSTAAAPWQLLQLQYHGSCPYSVISLLDLSLQILLKVLTVFFALMGIVVGAFAGAFADTSTSAPTGILRRIAVGAGVGAIIFVETLKSSQMYWTLEQSPSESSPSLTDFVHDLVTGGFLHDFLVPALSGAQQWQLNLREMTYEDIFDALIPPSSAYATADGASLEFLNGLPEYETTEADELDSCGEANCCPICLQDFQRGETARSLPKCNHTFHVNCVDQWLVKHALCPLCRQYL